MGPGVDPSWLGRAVVARTGSGGYADQVAVAADLLVPVPEGLGLLKAAALLHDGPTALGLFDNAEVRSGEHVLVTAAGGALGLLLVQLARDAGAQVVAAARGQAKLEAATQAGAATVVDYSEPDWAQQVLDSTRDVGVDVTFDGAGGQIGPAAFAVTGKGGRFSAHGAPSGAFTTLDPEEAHRRGITVRGIEQMQFPPDVAKRLIERSLTAAAEGRFTPVIGQTFSLDRAADAHAAIEDRRVVGKTLLLV